MTMTLPYREPLVPCEPGERQIPEPPRRGEPGGPPCGICGGKTTSAVWSDENWTLHPPVGGSLPGAVWLASRLHVDSFADLPDELATDFGRVAARVERAILSRGDVARVHLYRWGDGGAHFHVWFLPRPLGMVEASGMMLPLWEDALPNVPDSRQRAVGRSFAQETNERVQVVGRHSRSGVLVERLIGREHQRQVAVEELAQRLEPSHDAFPARAARCENRIHRRPEVLGELTDERPDQNVSSQPLTPQRRARPACPLGDTLERQSVEAALAQDLDRCQAEFLADSRGAARGGLLHRCS